MNKFPFTKQEFETIYAKVPRLTVEVLVHDSSKGVYLTLRDIEPCRGQWHLPGGTVYFGESLASAVARIAKREVGIDVISSKMVGYVEYPSHYENGIDHPVGLVFLTNDFDGQPAINNEATKGRWFTELPQPSHDDQSKFLVEHHYIKA